MLKHIRSVSRALSVIEALNNSVDPLSLNQIHQITELDRATLLRILVTLMEAGWVYRGLGDHNYRLTYQIHEMGTHIRPENSLAQLASPILGALQEEVLWPSDLSVYNGTRMEIIETTRSQSPLFVTRGFMGYQPNMLQSAVGRAFLAWSHPNDVVVILKRLQQGKTEDARLAQDEEWVRKVLQETRERGYGVRDDHYRGGPDDNEVHDVSAAAIPIMVMGEVLACINLIWIESLVTPGHLENELLPRLKSAADLIADLAQKNNLY